MRRRVDAQRLAHHGIPGGIAESTPRNLARRPWEAANIRLDGTLSAVPSSVDKSFSSHEKDGEEVETQEDESRDGIECRCRCRGRAQ